ncbi:MAG: VCBS repeat-containing protein [Planctomycetes bacterium]|nr:VCBS repeat-containing protein [Planctomycetota bacterium]
MRSILLTLLSIAALLLTNATSAQDAGSHCSLETSGLYGGTTFTIRLHSSEIGRPATVMFGQPASIVYPAPNPVLGIMPAGAYRFDGVIDSQGVFGVDYPLPSRPILSGQRIFGQGFVLHRNGYYQASERIALIGEASSKAMWLDASSYLPASSFTATGTDSDAVDYDHDGDLDLVISYQAHVAFLTNDGSGLFTDETATRLPQGNHGAFHSFALDFDIDGDQDILATGGFDAAGVLIPATLFANDGTGHFTLHTEFSTAAPEIDSAVVGDFTGNGYPDFYIMGGTAYGASGMLHQIGSLYLNQNGQFSLDTATESIGWNNQEAECLNACTGDIDNDGDLDIYLAMTQPGGANNILLLNDGTGQFTDVSLAQLPELNWGDGDKSSDATMADLNGDGYLDILVANSHYSLSAEYTGDLLMNRGAAAPGFFDDKNANWIPNGDPDCVINIGVQTADLDLDGDLDIMLFPSEWFGTGTFPFVGHPTLFLNQGGAQNGIEGMFEKDPTFWTPGPIQTLFTSSGALFDADADGDVDFYVPCTGGIAVDKTNDYFFLNRL